MDFLIIYPKPYSIYLRGTVPFRGITGGYVGVVVLGLRE